MNLQANRIWHREQMEKWQQLDQEETEQERCHVSLLHAMALHFICLQDQDVIEEPQLKKQRTGASELADARKLLVANDKSK